MEYNVIHNEAENRFEVEIDGLLSMVNYRNRDGVFLVTHTGVPKELSGQGIAAAMNKALLDYVRDNGYKVRPICPYTRAYVERHPEYQDILA